MKTFFQYISNAELLLSISYGKYSRRFSYNGHFLGIHMGHLLNKPHSSGQFSIVFKNFFFRADFGSLLWIHFKVFMTFFGVAVDFKFLTKLFTIVFLETLYFVHILYHLSNFVFYTNNLLLRPL